MVDERKIAKILNEKYPAPQSKRFCKNCGIITSFEYDMTLGHSVCKVCGFRNFELASKIVALLIAILLVGIGVQASAPASSTIRWVLHNETYSNFPLYKQLINTSIDIAPSISEAISVGTQGASCYSPNWTTANFSRPTYLNDTWNFTIETICTSVLATAQLYANIFSIKESGSQTLLATTTQSANICSLLTPTDTSWLYSVPTNTSITARGTIGVQICINVSGISLANTASIFWENKSTAIIFTNYTSNIIPTQGTPILNTTSGFNSTLETLTAYPMNVTDSDADGVQNITDWRLEGVSLALLNVPFEGGTNSTYAKDYSTYNHTISFQNGTYNATGGRNGDGALICSRNNASTFSGIFQYRYNITMVIEATPTAGFAADGGVVYVPMAIKNRPLEIQWRAGTWRCIGQNKTGSATIIGAVMQSNLSYHVVCLHDTSKAGAEVRLYVNGSLAATGALGGLLLAENQSVELCRSSNGAVSGVAFNGSISSLQFYNFTLSESQINQSRDEWRNNIQNKVMTSKMIVAGQNWTACITPNDGIDDGAMNCTNTVQMNNNVFGCGNITSSGNYTLTANLTHLGNGSCIVINNTNDIMFDCLRNNILLGLTNMTATGITAEAGKRITIQNCFIWNNQTIGSYNGIAFNGANQSLIRSNVIIVNGSLNSIAISLTNAAETNISFNNVTQNGTGTLNVADVISLAPSTNLRVVIERNNVTMFTNCGNCNGGAGIGVTNGGTTTNVNITWNDINLNGVTVGSSGTSRGIKFRHTGFSILNNNINTRAGQGILDDAGAGSNLIAGNNITITNTISAFPVGIFINGGISNVRIENNTIRILGASVNGIDAIRFDVTGGINNNNTVIGNTIINGATAGANLRTGINISATTASTFTNNNITMQPGGYAIAIQNSNGTVWSNNTLNNGSWITINRNTENNNFTNTTFQTANGSINIPGTFSITNATDITLAKLNVTQNKAWLNSTNLTFMNVTGIITLFGLNSTNARPTVDYSQFSNFVLCPLSICTVFTYLAGILQFNVSQFSAYSSIEGLGINFTTPTKADGYGSNALYVEVNVSISNLTAFTANITLINSSNNVVSVFNCTSNPCYINFTNLSAGNYTYNASANSSIETVSIKRSIALQAAGDLEDAAVILILLLGAAFILFIAEDEEGNNEIQRRTK